MITVALQKHHEKVLSDSPGPALAGRDSEFTGHQLRWTGRAALRLGTACLAMALPPQDRHGDGRVDSDS
jgi:hypothetical protein